MVKKDFAVGLREEASGDHRANSKLRSRHVAAVVLPALLLAGCSILTSSPAGPIACGETFTRVRCENMADYAAMSLGVPRAEIVEIAVLPPPTPEVRDGMTILQTRSGGPPVETVMTLRNGGVHQVSMNCGGIPALQCQDHPQLQATSVTMGGYFDTPCGGEPPDGCATDVPPPDPEALAAAVEMRIPRFDIPITRDGRYEVSVGEAKLPNGILTLADFKFVDPAWPSNMTIADGRVQLQVRSLDQPGRLFGNVHDHGTVPGTERVEGVIVFDVLRHDPGAVLSLQDLVIR